MEAGLRLNYKNGFSIKCGITASRKKFIEVWTRSIFSQFWVAIKLCELKFIQLLHSIGTQKYQKSTSETKSTLTTSDLWELHQTWKKKLRLWKKNLREQYSRLGHAPIRREKDAKREINMKGAAQRIYVFAWEIFTVLSLTKFRRLQTTVSHIKGREILHKMTFFSQLEKKQRQNQIISDSLNSFTKYLFL